MAVAIAPTAVSARPSYALQSAEREARQAEQTAQNLRRQADDAQRSAAQEQQRADGLQGRADSAANRSDSARNALDMQRANAAQSAFEVRTAPMNVPAAKAPNSTMGTVVDEFV